MEYTPPVGFYFVLSISGETEETASAFNEVSGLTMEMDTPEISEGGSNRFEHRLPTSPKYSNLKFMRGLIAKDSALAKWCNNTFRNGLENQIQTKTLLVKLLDAEGESLSVWQFENAWPVQWAVSDLDSANAELMIESLEFSYNFFERLT